MQVVSLDGQVRADFDGDADGMADWWEDTHFGSTNSPVGWAQLDFDRDGWVNLKEFWLNTIPTDRNSALRITRIENLGQDMRLWFTTSTSRRYVVEWSDSPGGPWHEMPPSVEGSGAEMSATDGGGAGFQKRFYRVGVRWPE